MSEIDDIVGSYHYLVWALRGQSLSVARCATMLTSIADLVHDCISTVTVALPETGREDIHAAIQQVERTARQIDESASEVVSRAGAISRRLDAAIDSETGDYTVEAVVTSSRDVAMLGDVVDGLGAEVDQLQIDCAGIADTVNEAGVKNSRVVSGVDDLHAVSRNVSKALAGVVVSYHSFADSNAEATRIFSDVNG